MATPDRPPVKDRPDRLQMAPPGAPAAPPRAALKGPAAAIRWGMGAAWTCRRILLFILAANFLVAALVLFPLMGPLDDSLAGHPEAAAMGRQMDPRWWFDFTSGHRSLITSTLSLLGAASFGMVFLSTFFSGGLLEALRHGRRHPLAFEKLPDPAYGGEIPQWRSASPGPATIVSFLRESARHFPRLLLLLVLSLPLYALVELLLNGLAAGWLESLLERVGDERVALLLGAIRSLSFLAAFQAVTVLFEYARAQEILRPGTTLVQLLALPFRLLRRRTGTLLGIEVLAFGLQGIAVLAFMPVDGLLSGNPVVAATAGFAAIQIFMFTRIFIRSAAQAAQLRLVDDLLHGDA